MVCVLHCVILPVLDIHFNGDHRHHSLTLFGNVRSLMDCTSAKSALKVRKQMNEWIVNTKVLAPIRLLINYLLTSVYHKLKGESNKSKHSQ